MSHTPIPADHINTPLHALLDHWHRLLFTLITARHDGADLAVVALDALAAGQSLADQISASRWVTVADALRHGARLDAVAAALAITEDEVAAGLRSWLDGQCALFERTRTLGVSVPERESLLALADTARTQS